MTNPNVAERAQVLAQRLGREIRGKPLDVVMIALAHLVADQIAARHADPAPALREMEQVAVAMGQIVCASIAQRPKQ